MPGNQNEGQRATTKQSPAGEQPTRIIFARHGQTDWNAGGIYHGQEDVPLNEMGRRQAVALADVLKGDHFDAIVSSPLSRALDTALAVAAGRGLEVITDDSLMEADAGEWVGLSEVEIFEAHPEYAAARHARRDHQLSSTGETTLESGRRIAAGVRLVAERHAHQRVLVVGHSYGWQVALGELMGWPLEQGQRVDSLFNGAMTELTVANGVWRLVAHNICHDQIPGQRTGEIRIV